jgi:hypothetical protein
MTTLGALRREFGAKEIKFKPVGPIPHLAKSIIAIIES